MLKGSHGTWICPDTLRKEKDEEAIEGQQRETAQELRSAGFWCENEQWLHSVYSPMSYPVKAPCRQCRQRRTE